MEDRLLKLAEAALLLGVTPQTVRQWDKDGKLRCVRTPGGHRRVRLSEVQKMMDGGSDDKNL